MKKIDLSTVKMGSDAEVFLIDGTDRPFPACGLIGGTKEKPRKLTDDGVAVQEDNVMLEFNTSVSSNPDEWAKNISRAYRLACKEIPSAFRPLLAATAIFDVRLLKSDQAQRFGCEPDFNAWVMEQNPRPEALDPALRSAAAHIHISWKEPDGIDQRCRVIQMADALVTLPSLLESDDRKRRELYGKAGAFRPKEYGVEHRVLDNYWLDERYTGSIWYRYMEALEAANGDAVFTLDMQKQIQDCINHYEVDKAEKLWNDLRRFLLPAKVKQEEELFGGTYTKSANKKKRSFNDVYTQILADRFNEAVVEGAQLGGGVAFGQGEIVPIQVRRA